MSANHQQLQNGNLVVFVGAGCSMISPTSLPSWWQVNRAVIASFVERSQRLLPNAQEIGKTVGARQDDYKLPPEYFAEVLAGTLGDAYFEVLQALDSRTPNAVHFRLAELARARKLAAVITTNFDRAIEEAFLKAGVPLEVRYNDAHFRELAADATRIGRPRGACQLLKIHGSAQDPATLIDTLSQRKRGLSESIVTILEQLLRSGHWLFLGYSGADLEAERDYLVLRPNACEARGFTWLVQEGRSPLAAVENLAKAYGSKASIQYGTLPAWLDSLLPARRLQKTIKEIAPSPAAKEKAVERHAAQWAESIGDFSCALVLATLLEVAGQSKLALEAFHRLFHSHPRSKSQVVFDYEKEPLPLDKGPGQRKDSDAGLKSFNLLCIRLARLLRAHARNEEAHTAYNHAVAASFELEALDIVAASLGQYANFLKGLGQLDTAERMFRRAILAASAHPEIAGGLNNDLGGVLVAQGRRDEARSAVLLGLEVRKIIGDELGRAGSLVNLATLSSPGEALKHYNEALTVLQRIGNEGAQSEVLLNLGRLYGEAGQGVMSAQNYEAARVVCEDLGDQRGLAMAMHGLAVAKDKAQDFDRALKLYERALAIAESADFKSERASILNNVGRLHRDRKDETEARAARRQAMKLYEEINSPIKIADTWYAMGMDDVAFGRTVEAVEPFRHAEKIYRALGVAEQRLGSSCNIAAALFEAGKYEEAAALYQELVRKVEEQDQLSEQEKCKLAELVAIGAGKCAFQLGNPEQGKQWFTHCLAWSLRKLDIPWAYTQAQLLALRARKDFGQDISALDLLGKMLNQLARSLSKHGQHAEAARRLTQLRDVAERDGDNRWLAAANANLGNVYRSLNLPDEALDSLRKAIDLYQGLDDTKGAMFPLGNLIELLHERGETDEAAGAMAELAERHDAVGETMQAAQYYVQAASLVLIPFGQKKVANAKEALTRALRAHDWLQVAQPVLMELEPQLRENAQYDLAYCHQLLEKLQGKRPKCCGATA